LFPIFLNLRGKLCTVVGGGEVATRKASALLNAGALVRLVAPHRCPALSSLFRHPGMTFISRDYRPGDLQRSTLVFAATDDPEVNAAVAREAESRGIPVNVADDPAHCTFFLPAVVNREPICIAISTSGASPALARHLKDRIAEAVPSEYQDLARLLGRLRSEVLQQPGAAEERRSAWQRVLDSEALSLLQRGEQAQAEAMARSLLGLGAPPPPRAEARPSKVEIVVGTRGSKLALAQANSVAAMLRELPEVASVEVKTIRTAGDAGRRANSGSAVGIFVKEIEQALLHGEVNLAVHSLKDLPTGDRPGLVLAAVPERADPHDALVTRTGVGLSGLPMCSKVATSSPRREAQLRTWRADLVFVPVRGNVDTRLRKLTGGEFDALVVAYAGLARLGLADRVSELIPFEVCLPAPGQGALALQVRADDRVMLALVSQLDHEPTRLAVTAERSLLARLGAGCTVPAGALGTIEDGRLILRGVLADPAHGSMIQGQVEGTFLEPELLGIRLAEGLLHDQGMGWYMKVVRR